MPAFPILVNNFAARAGCDGLSKFNKRGRLLIYIDALTHIVPWFFSLGGCLSVCVTWFCHPDIYPEFLKGKLVVKKRKHPFPAIALDHAHEQNNASMKGDGGAVGLTENPLSVQKWHA